MEYIAFKALTRDGDTLYSPQQLTAWMYDLHGRPCLVADGLDRGLGIHAATWQEAAAYGDKIYMVVPYLIDGDDPVIALGTHGWRSNAATVIAGPWERDDRDGMRQAAESILAFYQQGYRQVECVMMWAAGIVAAYDNNVIPIALPLLERAMRDGDPYVRQEAALTAGKLGAPAIPLLKRASRDNDLTVRLNAALAAGEIGVAALPLLERAMRDGNPAVRHEAVIAAVKIGVAALPLLELAARDIYTDVRRQALRVIGALGVAAPH